MIKLAFVGTHYRSQLEENGHSLHGVQVVACAPSISDLNGAQAQAIVCDLRDLGASPANSLRAMLARPGLELAVVTYSFAPREALEALRLDPRVRIVQGPLSLANLRAQMVHLIVRDILDQDAQTSSRPSPAKCPHCGGALTR